MTPAPRRRTSGAEPLASSRAARGHHFAAARCRHACAKTVTAFAHQLARLIGPLHGSFSAGRQCPDSEVRQYSRQAGMRTSESKDTSKFKVLVRSLDLKFLGEVAARPIGTSNPPHQDVDDWLARTMQGAGFSALDFRDRRAQNLAAYTGGRPGSSMRGRPGGTSA